MSGVDGRVTVGVVGVDVMTTGGDGIRKPVGANRTCIFELTVGFVSYPVHVLVSVHN